MKQIADLEKMKEQSIKFEGVDITEKIKEQGINLPISQNAFEHFINLLEDYYIGKSNGPERIRNALNDWDEEARKTIIVTLIDRLKKSGIKLNMGNLMELI